jgi:D-glycero-D-manno-heptose 1,7-bisphosphate phosphatase
MSRPRAAFIDRDGVVNQLVPDPVTGLPESPLRDYDVALLGGVAEALKLLASDGWLLVGVSNQPAAAKGIVSVGDLRSVQARVLELLSEEGAHFDAFRLCLHHPDAVVAELTGECECRKPAPGMLLDAARELDIDLGRSWIIGDTDSDILAGRAAGCRTALIEHAPSAHKRSGAISPDARVPSLDAAAALLVRKEQVH